MKIAVFALAILLAGCNTLSETKPTCAHYWAQYKLEADALTTCLEAPRCTLTPTDLKWFDYTHAQVLVACSFEAPKKPDFGTPIEPVVELQE